MMGPLLAGLLGGAAGALLRQPQVDWLQGWLRWYQSALTQANETIQLQDTEIKRLRRSETEKDSQIAALQERIPPEEAEAN